MVGMLKATICISRFPDLNDTTGKLAAGWERSNNS